MQIPLQITVRDMEPSDALEARIRSKALVQVQRARGPYIVLVVPLLVENLHHYDWVDRVMVVDVASELQRRLLMARDDIGDELANAMIAAQASRAARRTGL